MLRVRNGGERRPNSAPNKTQQARMHFLFACLFCRHRICSLESVCARACMCACTSELEVQPWGSAAACPPWAHSSTPAFPASPSDSSSLESPTKTQSAHGDKELGTYSCGFHPHLLDDRRYRLLGRFGVDGLACGLPCLSSNQLLVANLGDAISKIIVITPQKSGSRRSAAAQWSSSPLRHSRSTLSCETRGPATLAWGVETSEAAEIVGGM